MREKIRKLSYDWKIKQYCQIILIIFLCTFKKKSTFQARIKREIFVNLWPEPGPNLARTRPEKP